jgi:hypothetical protein
MAKNIVTQVKDLMSFNVWDARELVKNKTAKYIGKKKFLKIDENYFILTKNNFNGKEREYYQLLSGL